MLQQRAQIRRARRELVRRCASALDPTLVRLLRKIRVPVGVGIGDPLKSWDVLETLRFVEARVPAEAPILDLGAYASEVVYSLGKSGFSQLVGVDLNPRLSLQPRRQGIRFVVSDFLATPFVDGSFAVITAISVIEHGFQPARLLGEVSRLLAPEGFFVASFDYWPVSIDTSDVRVFDMDWTIFSREAVRQFADDAVAYGLYPVGPLEFEATERPVSFAGRAYTFAWLALCKS